MWEQLLEIGKGGADQGGIRLYKGGTSDPLETMMKYSNIGLPQGGGGQVAFPICPPSGPIFEVSFAPATTMPYPMGAYNAPHGFWPWEALIMSYLNYKGFLFISLLNGTICFLQIGKSLIYHLRYHSLNVAKFRIFWH